MAHPLVLVLGAAAAGALLMKQSQKSAEAKAAEEAARAKLLGQQASELEAGYSYSMQFMFIPEASKLQGVPNQSALIKATFEQLGFKALSTPQPADAAQQALAVQNKNASWVFAGVWRRRDKKYIDLAIPWLGQSMLFKLPAQPDMSVVV